MLRMAMWGASTFIYAGMLSEDLFIDVLLTVAYMISSAVLIMKEEK